MTAILADFLRLLGRQPDIPAALIADVVMFATGEKAALRFAVPKGVRVELDRWAKDHGLAGSARRIGLKRVADWTCLGVDELSATAHLDVVVYAKGQADASLICEIETSGSSEEAGRLLGYPPCCTAAYEGYSREPAGWIGQALTRSGPGPFPCWANRLPISWGAPTFIGELYPCSFDCAAAASQGRMVYERLQGFGLAKLAQTIFVEVMRPVAGGTIAEPCEARRIATAPDQLLEFIA